MISSINALVSQPRRPGCPWDDEDPAESFDAADVAQGLQGTFGNVFGPAGNIRKDIARSPKIGSPFTPGAVKLPCFGRVPWVPEWCSGVLHCALDGSTSIAPLLGIVFGHSDNSVHFSALEGVLCP